MTPQVDAFGLLGPASLHVYSDRTSSRRLIIAAPVMPPCRPDLMLGCERVACVHSIEEVPGSSLKFLCVSSREQLNSVTSSQQR